MKKYVVALLTGIQVLTFCTAFSQENLPKERVYVHTDKPFYVTGETIWFQADCLDASQPGLRSHSKVLYVELISKDGSPVKQVKVELSAGSGSGQILMTPDIISDKYQLRAYTSWMKNFGEEGFSTQELSVINPSAPPQYKASALKEDLVTGKKPLLPPASNEVLSISQKVFSEKEQVTITLNPNLNASVSLSAYKYHSSLEEPSRAPAQQWSKVKSSNGEIVYPPEILAPLVSGKITSADSLPDNLFAVLSGAESDMTFVSIDDAGEFVFEVSPAQANKELLFWSSTQPLDPERITINSPFFPTGKKELQLLLDTAVQDFLEDNVFNIQASHAYDSITNIKGKSSKVEPKLFFYGKPNSRYLLDDFTRFKTIKETIVEYVREAFLKKKKLTMLYERANGAFDGPGLVLLDGVPVTEDSLIMNFNPKKVKSIEIVTDYYVIGKEIFKGIINFITFENDYGNIPSAYLVEKPYQELLQRRAFFSPSYEGSESDRLPDFRNTLYWEPNIKLKEGEAQNVTFYSSMSTGMYKIELAGITSDGRPFFEELFFEVVKSTK